MSKEYIVSVVSKDEIGIIANISRSIEKLKGNLGDLSQNVLDGYFSMILFVTFQDEYSEEVILSELRGNYQKLTKEPFSINMWTAGNNRRAEGKSSRPSLEDKYVITAVSKDRTGLVAEVSDFCANRGLNIIGLETEVRNGYYNMIFFLDADASFPMENLEDELKVFESHSTLKLMLQHYKIFKATNEIKI